MKRNALIRCAAWLLTLCAVMPMAISCGDDSGKNPTHTTANKEADTIDENDPYADRLAISDDLGEYDFNKYQYRIITADERGSDFYMEGESADNVESAVYRRNRAVEERFNCEIVLLGDAFYTETANRINKDITSGDDLIDLVAHHVVSLGLLVGSELFLNWYDIPNINFDKPWWSDSNEELLTHSGVCFMAVGDLALSSMYQSYATFYNKRLGADYDMPDLFEVVNNGEWTIDTIISYSKDIYQDLNMDGKVDAESDLFGYASDYSSRNTYIWSFDNPIYKVKNGSLELVLRTDKLSSIYAKLVDEFNIYRGVQTVYKNGVGMSPVEIFAEGRAMFINAPINAALELRDMEDDYSILPMPKWDEAQEEYITM
ncbi:MAG: hypothetical protein J6S76_04865, partial [Clostridia bacterium]|nr:hypothetical protein [Clostridia bacterium]